MSARLSLPRPPPGPGLKLHTTRPPALRIRQAVRDDNVGVLQRLQHKMELRNADRNRLTSLSWAAIEGGLEVFEWLLLDYGHDDQELSRDVDNNTLLHLLASIPSPPSLSQHLHLTSPFFPSRPSTKSLEDQLSTSLRMTQLYHTVFPFLLDWSNAGGKTGLHVAAQSGNHSFISLLCDFGADVDLTDHQGNTPLHYASAWGHLECIRVLLERGCQFAARNSEGFTASDFAYSQAVMVSLQGMAREVHEERRIRRKEEKRVEAQMAAERSVGPASPLGPLGQASVGRSESFGFSGAARGMDGGAIGGGGVSSGAGLGAGAGASTRCGTNDSGAPSEARYPLDASFPPKQPPAPERLRSQSVSTDLSIASGSGPGVPSHPRPTGMAAGLPSFRPSIPAAPSPTDDRAPPNTWPLQTVSAAPLLSRGGQSTRGADPDPPPRQPRQPRQPRTTSTAPGRPVLSISDHPLPSPPTHFRHPVHPLVIAVPNLAAPLPHRSAAPPTDPYPNRYPVLRSPVPAPVSLSPNPDPGTQLPHINPAGPNWGQNQVHVGGTAGPIAGSLLGSTMRRQASGQATSSAGSSYVDVRSNAGTPPVPPLFTGEGGVLMGQKR